MRGRVLVALAACGGSSTPSDSPPTSATLTVSPNALGMVVSTPPGIQCGRCAVPMGCPDPQSATTCTYEFAVGTAMTLRLIDQQIYFAINCSPDPATPVTADSNNGCEFSLAQTTTVTILGVEAVR